VLGGFAGKSPHNAAGIFPKPCTCLREAPPAEASCGGQALRRRQGGTLGSLLHAFLGKTGTSRKPR